jgi:hypothetical protein
LRLHRRLRRLPRHLPGIAAGGRHHGARASVSVRVAGHPRRGGALARRARLREPRARLRALQHALAHAHAPLPPGRARGAARTVERRAHLVGAAREARRRGWLAPQRGPDHREGRDRDAQLRRGADAPRAALPGRRRGAHRAAHGGEGLEPRGGRRARARPGAPSISRGG